MRILHVSTFAGGGAGIAAQRLHKGLLSAGIDSTFLSLDSSTSHLAKVPKPKLSLSQRFLNRFKRELLSFGIKNKAEAKNEFSKFEGDFEIFTSPITNYDITLHPDYHDADIIHLHWVANFLDYSSFFKKNKKPVVWTLHDMNPFQGGFHYHGDILRNTQLKDIEENFVKIKQEALQNAEIHVVCLSKWMYRLSKQSVVLKNKPHYLIPNGVDIEVFKPFSKSFSKEIFNLPKDKKIFLFISDNISNYRKGFDMLVQAVANIKDHSKVAFCAVGARHSSKEVENIIYLEPIKDERLLAILYSAADAFILPSREDNLPNVMLEAMACGLPVISTPVGGMLDVIRSHFNGLLLKVLTFESLQETLECYIDNKPTFETKKIHDFVSLNYSLKNQVLKFKNLYEHVLQN